MAGYLNQNGNSIGSLLRFIQEQKSQSPIIPPSTEASSPIRGIVQEPLKSPEDTGTSKVVSLRPEGALGNAQGETVGQGIAQGIGEPTSPVVSSSLSLPTSSTTKGISRIASPSQMTPSGPVVNQSVVSPSSVTQPISSPLLGTKISSNIMPTTSKIGSIILEPKNTNPITTSSQSGTAKTFPQTGSDVPYPTPGPTPPPTASRFLPPIQQQQQKAPTKAPSLATIIGGGAWQGLKKLFGW